MTRRISTLSPLLPILAITLVCTVKSLSAQTPATSDAVRRQIEELTSRTAKESVASAPATPSDPSLKKLCIRPGSPASDSVVNSMLPQFFRGTKLQPEALTATLANAQVDEIKARECAFVLDLQIQSIKGGNNGALMSQVPAGLGAIPGIGQAGGSVISGLSTAGALLSRFSKPHVTAVFTLTDAASHKLIDAQKFSAPAQDQDAAAKLLTAVASAVLDATKGK